MKKGSFLVENSWTFYTAADTASGYAAERQGGANPTDPKLSSVVNLGPP